MYRVLPSPPRNRVLELCFDSPSILAGFAWPGESATVCELHRSDGNAADHRVGRDCVVDYRGDLPFPADSFDLVICHKGLDRLAAADPAMRDPSALAAFIRRVSAVLVQGGVLAVCVENTTVLSRWRRASRRPERGSADGAALSTEGWRGLLASGGLQRTQAFTVLPTADAPLRLINTDADLSRIGFRRELESFRRSLSLPGYAARSALVAMSLYRHWELALLAWGLRA